MSTLQSLRQRHPRFHYKAFRLELIPGTAVTNSEGGSAGGRSVRLQFEFLLEPDILFTPEITFPISEHVSLSALEPLAFQLGLVEMISYWKCACSPEIVVSAAPLHKKTLQWWTDLFLHGLGEFYYHNDIDFSQPDFFTLQAESYQETPQTFSAQKSDRDLILVGGGKDSSLTLELLSSTRNTSRVMALNGNRSSLDSARIAGFARPLLVSRRIDPLLLELNQKAYLNGHTPFSAYLAFLSTLVAAANGFSRILVSNEASADEANLKIAGMPINHQYSKSFRFERRFREYAKTHLSADIEYYSVLRPLHDIQISMLFSRHERQLRSFRSCNVNQRKDSWCAKCPKCAFVFLTLAPFLSAQKMTEIFGSNFFLITEIQDNIRDLIGKGEGKPFECVGTIEESLLALKLSIEKEQTDGLKVPAALQALLTEEETMKIDTSLLQSWSSQHFLPLHQEALLKSALKEELHAFLGT